MALVKTKRDSESVAENTGGNSKYLNKPGFYDVEVLAAMANPGNGDSLVIDLFIDNEGQQQPLYGNIRILNNNGEENPIGMSLFNKLLVIQDLEEAEDPEEAVLPIGKGGADKDVAIVPNLTEFPISLQLNIEYSVYNGSINEKKIIRNFFRASDHATAAEIVNEVDTVGGQYTKDVAYFESSDNKGYIYKDGLDAATVEKWIKDKRPKNTVSGTATGAVKKPSFAKKKRFGK